MRSNGRAFFNYLLATASLILTMNPARADFITIGSTIAGLGTFTGNIEYNTVDASHATLLVQLTNTSPAANGGYLTAFVLNNPSNLITGATLTADNTNFNMIGDPAAPDGVNAPPFGRFDFGASTSNGFLGGGAPQGGIGVGQTASFLFTLTGTGLDGLSNSSFMDEFSTGDGEVAFLARFRGFNNGGSDKVPGVEIEPPPPPNVDVPEPGTLTLAGLAVIGALSYRRRRGR